MRLEQAIYTSSKTRRGEGYHVVARSAGITSENVTALNRWCPSHAVLGSDTNAETMNFHPLAEGGYALSRTTHGGKEFSGRGGLQVVTIVLLLKPRHLAGYDNNPFRLARVAQSLGHLRWSPGFSERLPLVELPDVERAEEDLFSDDDFPNVHGILHRLKSRQRVACISPSLGAEIVEGTIRRLPVPKRLDVSFTTGLKWSKQRPFALHIIKKLDERTSTRLSREDIHVVKASLHGAKSPFAEFLQAH